MTKNQKAPSESFEMIRRRLFEDIKDVKYYINAELESIRAEENISKIKNKVYKVQLNFQDRIK